MYIVQQVHKDIKTKIFVEALLIITITKGELSGMLIALNLQAAHLQDLFPESALAFTLVSH